MDYQPISMLAQGNERRAHNPEVCLTESNFTHNIITNNQQVPGSKPGHAMSIFFSTFFSNFFWGQLRFQGTLFFLK